MLAYTINHIRYDTGDTFGINVFSNNVLIKSIYAVTNEKSEIEQLVKMCNELKIEPCHIDYIIEDYLTDFCI